MLAEKNIWIFWKILEPNLMCTVTLSPFKKLDATDLQSFAFEKQHCDRVLIHSV